MGMGKRDHIAAISGNPDVAKLWMETFHRPCGDADIQAMYESFLPLQREALKHHSDVIPGVADAVSQCRARGLKIGSTTGYTRDLMTIVVEAAREQGYTADCVVCEDDVPRGRPAPFLPYEAARQLDVYPMWSIVNVDNTAVGIESGRHAGCWRIGVTRSGNGVGRSA